MSKLGLDDRMKDFYEIRDRRFLTRRTPVIIRIDGKAFHTYTRGLDKPFDAGLVEDMQLTMKYLCENIQGCRFGYCQSDEISLLLTDYETFETDAWFDYCQNKVESLAASMATAYFNNLRLQRLASTIYGAYNSHDISLQKLALFDARAFNIPREEVTNYFVWRQQDATKNSISMLAQSLYPHKELQGKNGNEMQEMCWKKGINWNNLPSPYKRGTACYKKRSKKDLTTKVSLDTIRGNPEMWLETTGEFGSMVPSRWGIYADQFIVDSETPVFSQDRTLIESFV